MYFIYIVIKLTCSSPPTVCQAGIQKYEQNMVFVIFWNVYSPVVEYKHVWQFT